MHVVQGELSSERSSGRRYLAKSTAPFGSRASPILSASRSSHHRCPAEPSECTRTPRLPGAKPWRGEPRRTRSVGPSQFAGTAPLRFPVCCAVEASSVSSKGPPPPSPRLWCRKLSARGTSTGSQSRATDEDSLRVLITGINLRVTEARLLRSTSSQIFALRRRRRRQEQLREFLESKLSLAEAQSSSQSIAERGEFHTQGPPGRRQVATLQNLELQRDEANERRVWAVWVCLGGAGSVGA